MIFDRILAPIELKRAMSKHARGRVDVPRAGKVVLPVFNLCGVYDTVEGCALRGEFSQDFNMVFKTLPAELKHELSFSPDKGECAQRARFWKEILPCFLPPQRSHALFQALLVCYRNMIHRRKEHRFT